MPDPVGLECIRCGTLAPLDDFSRGCKRCTNDAPSNLRVTYPEGVWSGLAPTDLPRDGGLWRYAPFLPVAAEHGVSLGEGGTPLVATGHLGSELGLERLYCKDETRNPSWSFKDRLASVAISMAKCRGARIIATSSSGNAGAAAAAYAAKAGLPCIVVTFKGTAGPMVTQMRAYGAMVLEVTDKADRWKLLQQGVERFGWYPTSPFFAPAIGSNPFGIEGYKTIAYEVAEQLGWQAPDWCVLPVCYGDALYGMARGFEELVALGWIARGPRLIAAEIHGSLAAGLTQGGDRVPAMPGERSTVAVSIGATQGTYQALHVIRATGGAAVQVDDADLMHWQRRLAQTEGLYAEPASVAPLAAIARLRQSGRISPEESVVALITASGLKDPRATARDLADLPLVSGDLDSARAALRETYGFRLEDCA